MNLNTLEKHIFACNKCTRLRQVTPIPYPHVTYQPITQTNYMIVARNPGLEHNYSNISKQIFINIYRFRFRDCNIGKYLQKIIGAKIFSEIFFTNICKCSSPGNSFLHHEEIENCREYLNTQIELVRPEKIITFGAEALTWFCSDLDLKGTFGKSYHRVRPFRHIVIPLYHPSYFNYKPNKKLEEKQERILRYNLK